MDSQQTQPLPAATDPYGPLPEGPKPEPLYNAPPPGSSPLPYHPSPNSYPPPPPPPPSDHRLPSSSHPPGPPHPPGQEQAAPPSHNAAPPIQPQPQAQPPLIPNTSPLPPNPKPSKPSNHGPDHGLTHAPPIPIPDDGRPQHPSFPPPAAAATTTTTATHPPTHNGLTINHPNPPTAPPPASQPLKTTLAEAESSLRELIALHRQRTMAQGQGQGQGQGRVNGVSSAAGGGGGGGAGKEEEVLLAVTEQRVREQVGTVLAGLEALVRVVGEVQARGEGQRWRRWVVGGVFASIIPLVKAVFRRPRDDEESANKTEYAFKKSKSLISRILASTRRPGIGTLAFFVFAVLYVFSNEVSLRVARTVSRRLKRLVAKVEDGREPLTDDDLKLLRGWRWRILLWSE